MISVSRLGDTAHAVWDGDANVLHHALILMVEDVTMQNEVTDVALVACAYHDDVVLFHEQRVLPGALEIGVLGIVVLPGDAHVLSVWIQNLHHLEWVDVNMERMVGEI